MSSGRSKLLAACLSFYTSLGGSSSTRNIHKKAEGLDNAVYFVNWGIYARNYLPQNLPADKITNVLYAFANFQDDGTVVPSDSWSDVEIHWPGDSWNDPAGYAYGCVKQLYLLKKDHRHMKVLLSIGGWTYSLNGRFASAVSTDAKRAQFARTSVSLMKDWGFDGVDIDWEYPQDDTEAQNFVLLLRAIRAELDAYAAKSAPGYHFRLTAAMPAGPENYKKLRLGDMSTLLDTFYLMAYDYAGSFSSKSGHQANLYPNPNNPDSTPFSTDRAVTDYVAAGVPAEKIVLGMPLYGRAFEGTAGLGQAYSGVGSGSWENGIWDYKVLPRPGGAAEERYDDVSGATYSYDAATRELISYDTAEMVGRKVAYLRSKGMGGSMFWEASGDRNDTKSLIGASFTALGGLQTTENNLRYPDSKYANIASGMV